MIRDGEHVPAGHVYVFFGKQTNKQTNTTNLLRFPAHVL